MMNDTWTRLGQMVRASGAAALVTVLEVRGSAPREAGVRMIVAPDGGFSGTIGGGQLEWEAIQLAAGQLRSGSGQSCLSDFSLGPDLGQCCGGRALVAVERFDRSDLPEIETFAGLEASGGFACEAHHMAELPHAARRLLEDVAAEHDNIERLGDITFREHFRETRVPVMLFGAGHVGKALVLALANLPFRLTWIDSRSDAFPAAMPQNVSAVRANRPADQIRDACPGSLIIVMTHSHPLDLELARAALSRADLPYVGVIGSATKSARFLNRLRASGLDEMALARFRCPIGIAGIEGKSPPVVAASVAAELLLVSQADNVSASGTEASTIHSVGESRIK